MCITTGVGASGRRHYSSDPGDLASTTNTAAAVHTSARSTGDLMRAVCPYVALTQVRFDPPDLSALERHYAGQ